MYLIGSERTIGKERIGSQLLREIQSAIEAERGTKALVEYIHTGVDLILNPKENGNLELIGAYSLSSFDPPVAKIESNRATVRLICWANTLAQVATDYLQRVRSGNQELLDQPVEWLLVRRLEQLNDKIRKYENRSSK